MKKILYLSFALILLMMSWESQTMATPLVQDESIPEKSIRLRIIANSDSPGDQWLKRQVRDEIIKDMNRWVQGVENIEEARRLVRTHMDEFHHTVETTIEKNGFHYPADITFGKVSFPTKMYGQYVYPAGKYEALRVTIGEGLGQNWWCVLFPPLCFVDMSNGDAVKASKSVVDTNKKEGSGELSTEKQSEKQIEIRFFVVDMWNKVKSWF